MVLGLEVVPELMPVALQVVWSLKVYGFSVRLYPHIKGKDVG